MVLENTPDVIYKEVVVVGNGPSGIALSYFLSGNLPFVKSDEHPDEFLSARLEPAVGQCLVKQDLQQLSDGLEGRSMNPVSLLMDALLHPCADIGLEMEPLLEFRKVGVEVDHVVLGKGPPGGSWHRMDPYILTLSLGSWMALPGLPFQCRDSGEKRAYASNVASYYVRYVREMGLEKYFVNNALITEIKPVGAKRKITRSTSLGQQDSPENHHGHNLRDPVMDRLSRESLLEEDSGAVHLIYHRQSCSEENLDAVSSSSTTNQMASSNNNRPCPLASAFNFILSRGHRNKIKPARCCKRTREQDLCRGQSPTRKIREVSPNHQTQQQQQQQNQSNQNNRYVCQKNRNRSISFSCDDSSNCSFRNNSLRNSYSVEFKTPSSHQQQQQASSSTAAAPASTTKVPFRINTNAVCDPDKQINWLVETRNVESGETLTYACKYLVLATGASDLPNRLDLNFTNGNNPKPNKDPSWLFHDLRSLEYHLDQYLSENKQKGVENVDPVLIVGAGLSAADAVIATRGRNVPVLHVFRNKSPELSRQLPENMYPEYHKVHQMMQDGGSTYPNYTAYPEYNLSQIDEESHTVTLTSKSGDTLNIKVSFVAVLIGARPDLGFLPDSENLGVKKGAPIDCKTNTLDIDKFTHEVEEYPNLFAIGPLAGDNFVRFIPGGALAVVAELYKRNNYICC